MEKKTSRLSSRKFWTTLITVVVSVYLLVTALLTLLLVILGGIFFYLREIAPNLNATLDRDIANYREYSEKVDIDSARLRLLPATIGADMTVNDYYFLDASFKYYKGSQYHIFLDVTYTEEGYTAELSRLQTYQAETLNDGLFSYSAYIASYNGEEEIYEYALLTGENRIVYVYLQGALAQNDLRMPMYYLPNDYYQTAAEEKPSYDIYGEISK